MKELQFLINDVREQTDNNDTNGVKDREFVRYFNDGVKTIQALIFKNNPLCSYYQEPLVITPVPNTRIFDLPTDCYADNAVSLVEMKGNSGSADDWYPIDRVWPEDGQAFFGWYTRNKQLYISGQEGRTLSAQMRVWYFKRLPRFDKAWATYVSRAGQVITLSGVDLDLFKIDRFCSFITPAGSVRVAGLSFVKTTDTTITVVGDISSLVAGDMLVLGKNSLMTLDVPEECEPYLTDYVAQRVVGRNNYTEDWNKMNFWTAEERSNITAIFADASQAQTRAPITDTEYMRI